MDLIQQDLQWRLKLFILVNIYEACWNYAWLHPSLQNWWLEITSANSWSNNIGNCLLRKLMEHSIRSKYDQDMKLMSSHLLSSLNDLEYLLCVDQKLLPWMKSTLTTNYVATEDIEDALLTANTRGVELVRKYVSTRIVERNIPCFSPMKRQNCQICTNLLSIQLGR